MTTTSEHDIGWAVEHLMLGESIKRSTWGNRYIVLERHDDKMIIYSVIDRTKDFWQIEQCDILGNDWSLA